MPRSIAWSGGIMISVFTVSVPVSVPCHRLARRACWPAMLAVGQHVVHADKSLLSRAKME